MKNGKDVTAAHGRTVPLPTTCRAAAREQELGQAQAPKITVISTGDPK